MSEEKEFTCPYCNNSTTLSDNFFIETGIDLDISKPKRYKSETFTNIIAITCPNPKCKELTFGIELITRDSKYTSHTNGTRVFTGYDTEVVKSWDLLPEANIKIFPKYIPKPILNDYNEACQIKKLSPKASATLSRRCLQGIIRDFWEVRKDTLKEEVNELETLIDNDLWVAIDDIRKVGNIGAHMEKDINMIIDVDPKEAQILIDLIEILLNEWYVKKHEKEAKLSLLRKISESKDKKRKKKNAKT
ncbi:DUF4145 domain-containing protein [Candidatus Dojkabacteria bacterium]|uniref:DUF4145 domain-containing protein n=1 Tax=Candidatus Dojkabacteria bacterium TaxID=2099670 RepID=A0A847VDS6_9BACT|nr:DUF4145 domain-containing protein [Candidatus Dojkabacteria bacterium]